MRTDIPVLHSSIFFSLCGETVKNSKSRKVDAHLQSTQVDYYNDIRRETGVHGNRPIFPRGDVSVQLHNQRITFKQPTLNLDWASGSRPNCCTDATNKHLRIRQISDLCSGVMQARSRPKRRRRTQTNDEN